MAPTLPPEVLANIVYQVFRHTRHLRTLHSLLCSSKLLFRETAAVLYYDPFKAASLAINTSALSSLFCFLIRLSPLDDEAILTFRKLLDLSRIENPTIDYLSLIASDKLQLADVYNRQWNSLRLVEEAGFRGLPLEVNTFNMQLQASLAWTIYGCGNRLSGFKRIHLPDSGLARLCSHVHVLRRLEILELEELTHGNRRNPVIGDRQGLERQLRQKYKDVAHFTQQMQELHGPNQLKDIWMESCWRFSSEYQLRHNLKSMLPQVVQPTVFGTRKDLVRLQDWSTADLDLSHLEKVVLDSDTFPSFPLYHLFEIWCSGNMPSMKTFITDFSPSFAWAADKRRKYEEFHRQQSMSNAESTLKPISLKPLPLFQLRHVALCGSDSKMVEDAMFAFGSSLEDADFHLDYSRLMQTYGASWCLPKLRSLKLRDDYGGFTLHARALDHMPNLFSLSLQSIGHVETLDGFSTVVLQSSGHLEGVNSLTQLLHLHAVSEPWTRLQQLTKLTLAGLSSVSFDPSSLQWMPQLESLTVIGFKRKRTFIYTTPSAVVGHLKPALSPHLVTPFANSHLWTWDWWMPSLQVVDLQGDVAARFRFRWLKHCPKLRVLSLNIKGTFRYLSLSDFADTDSDDKNKPSSSFQWSSTLEELIMRNHCHNFWLFSPESLEALLRVCGPRLTMFHCTTRDSMVVQHLSVIARTTFQHLKRIDLDPAVTRRTRRLSGLQCIGRTPYNARPDVGRHQLCLIHKIPRRYRDRQLWFFGASVFVHADEIEEDIESGMKELSLNSSIH